MPAQESPLPRGNRRHARGTAKAQPKRESRPKREWWKKPRNRVMAAVGAGVTAAVVPMISGLVTGGAARIGAATGLSSPSAPLSWTVAFDDGQLNACHGWTFPQPLAAIPFHDMAGYGRSDGPADEVWALQHGGVDEYSALFDITVQGKTDAAVVIRDLRVKVLSRKASLSGTRIVSETGCGAEVSVRYLSVDLSSAKPELVLNNTDESTAAPAAEYTVSQSDPEVFAIEAYNWTTSGPRHDETYVYEFDWSQGSASGTVDVLAPDGRPFELNNPSDDPTAYTSNQGVWANTDSLP